MVSFRLIMHDDVQLVYWYFPEGDESDHGVIIIDLKNQTVDVKQIAKSDTSREVSVQELNKMRDDINNMRVQRGEEPLSEAELPSATEPMTVIYYADHAVKTIVEALEHGELLEDGKVNFY